MGLKDTKLSKAFVRKLVRKGIKAINISGKMVKLHRISDFGRNMAAHNYSFKQPMQSFRGKKKPRIKEDRTIGIRKRWYDYEGQKNGLKYYKHNDKFVKHSTIAWRR